MTPSCTCFCIGHLEARDGRPAWVIDVLDAECPVLAHRAGVAA